MLPLAHFIVAANSERQGRYSESSRQEKVRQIPESTIAHGGLIQPVGSARRLPRPCGAVASGAVFSPLQGGSLKE